jgi:hypothetical protein
MQSQEIATVPTDPMVLDSTFEGRRQQERAKLRLPGRCMLANRLELICTTIDLAPSGVAVECGDQGQVGDRVVAYINRLGRIEGEIARQLRNGFAFKVAAPPRKIEKLSTRIAWLVKHDVYGAPDNRQRERVEADEEQIIVTTPDGEEYVATLIDVSNDGAAVNVAIAPPIGSPLTVGQRRARVVRHFAGGVAVKYQNMLRLQRRLGDAEWRDLATLVDRLRLTLPAA